ncbi:MAG: nickel-type superoxide dismutase maturation protease [Dehalococcoidia bacterium]|nr:nickel-type superoxide dismutase maturation protease [Dehalococcoidia bacterium]NUQ54768.1 nickel-type superoxide dismutase maturation protease [Dehalococcoidia bacterium]
MKRTGDVSRRRVPLFLTLAHAAGLTLVARWARRRFLPYEIAGTSMSPSLEPGDFVLVDRQAFMHRPPRRGEIVLVRDPREPRRTLVKRLANADLHGALWVLGDNPDGSTDSRAFGAVPPGDVIGRVRWRYWPPRAPSRVR